MNAQDTLDTTTAPTWLNLNAVVDAETVATLHELGDGVAAALEGLAPLLERCYRTLHRLDDVELGPFGETYGGGDGVYEAIYVFSGARRLSDLLYLLGAHVEGAAGENVERHEIPWLKQARADLGLNERGVKVADEG